MSAPYRTYPVAETVIDAPLSKFFVELAALNLHNISMHLAAQVSADARMTATRVGYDQDLLELAVYDADEACMVFVGWARLS